MGRLKINEIWISLVFYVLSLFSVINFIFYFYLQSLTLQHDPGTSDDSGRASERLTTSSVAPRDADSSRDRLSDVSFSFAYFKFYFITTLKQNFQN